MEIYINSDCVERGNVQGVIYVNWCPSDVMHKHDGCHLWCRKYSYDLSTRVYIRVLVRFVLFII